MRAVSRTDVGRVRAENQDSLVVAQGISNLYAVADGMGGHRGGNIASEIAVTTLKKQLLGLSASEDMLRKCIRQINLAIFGRQMNDEQLSGMGTTLTVLWELPEAFLLGHVGDSRCYRLRGEELKQISTDHSLVGELLNSGILTEEEAATYPYRNVITRAVGTDQKMEPDVLTVDKRPGDRFLLCSDGLTEYLKKDRLLSMMQHKDLDTAADRMMRYALDGGGQDNITLILLEVDE